MVRHSRVTSVALALASVVLAVFGCGESATGPEARPPAQRAPVAAFSFEDGRVFLNDRSFDAPAGAPRVLSVAEGDTLRVESAAQATLTWPEGIEFKPKPGTHAQIFARRVRLEAGDTWITLEKQGKGFVVQTPTLAVTVRGTRFRVQVAPDGETSVEVEEGVVHLAAKSGEGEAKAGDTAVGRPDGTLTVAARPKRGSTGGEQLTPELKFDPSRSDPGQAPPEGER